MTKEDTLIKIIKNLGFEKKLPYIAYDHINKFVIMGIRRLEACKEYGVKPNIIDGLGRNYKLDKTGVIVPDF